MAYLMPGVTLWVSKNKKWQIQEYEPGKILVTNGYFNDYPIKQNNTIAFDYPERIPQYVKNRIEKYL